MKLRFDFENLRTTEFGIGREDGRRQSRKHGRQHHGHGGIAAETDHDARLQLSQLRE